MTVGGSGYSEFAAYIESGKMRPIGVTSGERLEGRNVPTLKEQGIDVEIGNWRGVYGAPGISDVEKKQLVAAVKRATETNAWKEALQKNDWTSALLTGDEFGKFVDKEFESLRTIMTKSGMIS